jgi:hypothetical protein
MSVIDELAGARGCVQCAAERLLEPATEADARAQLERAFKQQQRVAALSGVVIASEQIEHGVTTALRLGRAAARLFLLDPHECGKGASVAAPPAGG